MDEDFEDESEMSEEELEQEQEELEQEEQEMREAQKRAEERILKNKLKAILTKVRTSRQMVLNPFDLKTVNQARKNKKMQADVAQIYVALATNTTSNISKVMASSPALYYICIGALCIFLIIAVVIIVSSLIPNLFPDASGDSTGNSLFGITGKDFYGARMVYKDDELANKQIIEDYVDLVELSANNVEQITSVTTGGKNYSLVLDVTLELPNEDYDYETFEEQQFKTDYALTYNLVLEIAKLVYSEDNGSSYSGTSLLECVNGVKYFGYANIDELSDELTTQILTNTTIQASDENGAVTNSSILNSIKTQITTNVTNNLQTEFALDKYSKRTEKLFIKDYILNDDEAQMSGITQENYVALIFMPKKEVNFTKLSFSVGGTNLSDFKMKITNNGTPIIVGTDGKNLGDETNFAYLYETTMLGTKATVFTDIDTNNLNKLSTPQSLFEIVKTDANYSIYLSAENVGGVELLTYKKNGMVVETENSEKFMLVEFETHWG